MGMAMRKDDGGVQLSWASSFVTLLTSLVFQCVDVEMALLQRHLLGHLVVGGSGG
jgi:hypothetical protein